MAQYRVTIPLHRAAPQPPTPTPQACGAPPPSVPACRTNPTVQAYERPDGDGDVGGGGHAGRSTEAAGLGNSSIIYSLSLSVGRLGAHHRQWRGGARNTATTALIPRGHSQQYGHPGRG